MPNLIRPFPIELLRALAKTSNDKAIAAAIAHLIPACSAANAPLKSLHAYLRLMQKHDARKATVETIRVAVGQALPSPEPRLGSVEWAAKVRGVSPRSIKQKLHTVVGRRLYGWPMWTGHAWDIPVAAVEPSTRGAYLQSISAGEPEAQQRSLPPWCEREVRAGEHAA